MTNKSVCVCVCVCVCVYKGSSTTQNGVMCVLSHVRLWDPRDCSHQAPLSMEFFRQEYWNGLSFPFPANFPDPGIKSASPVPSALQADSLPAEPNGEP